MNLNQLYYFRRLAELQHYSHTAAELYISQPTLSHSIKTLEEELGTTLFKKNGRNAVLTAQGKAFYLYVSEALKKLDDGVNLLKKSISLTVDKINISTIPLFSADFIPKNIRTYTNSHPQTTFDIFTCTTSKKVISGIKDGIYDIGFCFKTENENNLSFLPVLRHELVIVTKAGHELSRRRKLELSDLQEYPLITYRESNPIGISIRNLFREQGIIPNIVLSFDEEITISEMVAYDFGIAILPNSPILKQHSLSVIPINVKADLPILHLVYRSNYNYSESVKSFINLLISCAAVV